MVTLELWSIDHIFKLCPIDHNYILWSSNHMNYIINSPDTLGSAIRTARLSAGLTQTELGQKIGMDQATISNVERGNVGTRLDTMFLILSVLDLKFELVNKKISSKTQGEW